MDLTVRLFDSNAARTVRIDERSTSKEVIEKLEQINHDRLSAVMGRPVLAVQLNGVERILAPGERPFDILRPLLSTRSSSNCSALFTLYRLTNAPLVRRPLTRPSSSTCRHSEASAGRSTTTAIQRMDNNASSPMLYQSSSPRASPAFHCSRRMSNSSTGSPRHPPPSYEETMQNRCKSGARLSIGDERNGTESLWPPVKTAAQLIRFVKGQNAIIQEQQDVIKNLDLEISLCHGRPTGRPLDNEMAERRLADLEKKLESTLSSNEALRNMKLERQIGAIRRNLERTSSEVKLNSVEIETLENRLARSQLEADRLRAEIDLEKRNLPTMSNESASGKRPPSPPDLSDLEDQIDQVEGIRKAKLATCHQLRQQLRSANLENLEECLEGLKMLQAQSPRRVEGGDSTTSTALARGVLKSSHASVWV